LNVSPALNEFLGKVPSPTLYDEPFSEAIATLGIGKGSGPLFESYVKA
jgi:hypothetical protein